MAVDLSTGGAVAEESDNLVRFRTRSGKRGVEEAVG
jgi:hypothetical protein